MYRGTTPVLLLNVHGDFDWSEVTDLQVTLRNNVRAISYTKSNVVWDGEKSRLLIQMSQNDTLALSGDIEVQLRYQILNGNAFASNIARMKLERIISSNVVGDDVVNVRMRGIEADVDVQPNEEDVEIDIEHGEAVYGEPRINDIAVNGEKLPIEEGVVYISIPTNLDDLQGTEELKETIERLSTSLGTTKEELGNVSTRVTNVENGLEQKATKDELKSLSDKVDNKAEQSALNSVKNDVDKKATKEELETATNALSNSISSLGNRVTKNEENIAKKANSSDVYTKTQSDQRFLREHQSIKTINGKSMIGDGNVTIDGMTDAERAKLDEIDDKANANDLNELAKNVTKKADKSDIATINGQSILNGGKDIQIQGGGKGDVQSVSVNGGEKQIPDAEGNINLEIEEGGAKSIADLEDGNRVDELESAVSSKANQSDLNSTNTKVATLEQEVGKKQDKLKAGANINIEDDGTISASGEVSAQDDVARKRVADIEEVLNTKSAQDKYYITDADKNIIAKIDAEGITTTNVRLLQSGKEYSGLDLLKSYSSNIQDGYEDALYITDSLGYAIAKFDKDGIDYVGKIREEDNSLVDSGETRSDIVYNILYGRSLSYHGIIAHGANMHTCLQFDTTDGDYMMLGLTDPDNAESVEEFFKGLIPSKTGLSGTSIAHANRMFMELLRNENGINIQYNENREPNYSFQLLGANPGVVTNSVGLMNPQGVPYKRLIESVRQAKKFAELDGKTFSVGCVCYMEAEEINTFKDRYDKLWVFASNVNHDIQAITGQKESVYLLSYQYASHYEKFNVESAYAQLQIALDEGVAEEGYEISSPASGWLKEGVHLIDRKYIQMGAIMNSLDYSSETDHVHATQNSYLACGSQFGVQIKRTLYDGNPITPIHVQEYNIHERADGKYNLSLKFHVPVRPLVFDTANNDCQSKRATSANYGFELTKDDTDIIESVNLRRGQEVVIVTSEDPRGCVLTYANDGWETGGNLRDSQNIVYSIGGFYYIIHNWCPTFQISIN